MKIWLDDTRDPDSTVEGVRAQSYMRGRPDDECAGWHWVRTAAEAITLLSVVEVEEISLDHDLGDNPLVGNGNQVVVWLEEATVINDDYWPPVLHVHSGNPGAGDKMVMGLKSIEKHLAIRGEEPPLGPRRPPRRLPRGEVFE